MNKKEGKMRTSGSTTGWITARKEEVYTKNLNTCLKEINIAVSEGKTLAYVSIDQWIAERVINYLKEQGLNVIDE